MNHSRKWSVRWLCYVKIFVTIRRNCNYYYYFIQNIRIYILYESCNSVCFADKSIMRPLRAFVPSIHEIYIIQYKRYMYIFYELCLFLYLHTLIILVFYIYNAYVDGVGGFSTDVSILSLSITGFDYALGSPPPPRPALTAYR